MRRFMVSFLFRAFMSGVLWLAMFQAAFGAAHVADQAAGTLSSEPAHPSSPAAPTPRLSLSRETPLSEQPFWKRKPELKKRMAEERAVLVSVRREDVSAPRKQIRFTMRGAGWVNKPKDFCFLISQQYFRLPQISDHFRKVSFDPTTNELFVIAEALKLQARMIMKVIPVTESWRSELQWEVIWGQFKGMTGVVGFEKVADDRTEMSIEAKYLADELPLPKHLVGLALEVVVQKVAEKLRSFIEAQSASALIEKVPAEKAPVQTFFPLFPEHSNQKPAEPSPAPKARGR